MSARRYFAISTLVLAACRCGDETIVVNIADGVVIAPHAAPEAYASRIEALGIKYLLVPWTRPESDVAAWRGINVELIVGLTPARSFEREWNGEPPAFAEAIARAKVAGDDLDGVHLDHAGPEAPDPSALAGLEEIRAAFPDTPLSFAIRRADLAWIDLLAGKVDRIVVHTDNAARDQILEIKDELETFRSALAGRAELWATVESASALATAAGAIPPRVRPPRKRDVIQAEVDVLRSYTDAVFVNGADIYEPERLLAPDASDASDASVAPARETPAAENAVDINLENRAEDMNDRLRRCCLRENQVIGWYDHRFERDEQPISCRLTGYYAAALSFRAKILKTAEAEDDARGAWRALDRLAELQPNSDEDLQGWFLGVTLYRDLVATEDEKREIAADLEGIDGGTFYTRIMYETDPARRRAVELELELHHQQTRRNGDAFADTVYGVIHPDRDTARRAYDQLERYRPELTSNAALFAEVDALHPGPFVPLESRPAAELDFADYAPPSPAIVRGGLEHRSSGVVFLLSYWMARYHGLR